MFSVYKNISLKLKVTLFTLGLFLFSIALLTYYFSLHLRQELEVSLSSHQFSEVSFVAERIENAVKLRTDSLAVLASSITPEMLAHHAQLTAFLVERKAIYKLFTMGTIVISKEGRGIVDYPVVEGRGTGNYAEREFYRQVMATGKPALSKPSLGRFIKDPRLVIAVPIFDKNSHIVGVFAGIVSLGDGSLLSDFDAKTHPNTSSYLIVSPRDNLYVAASDRSLTLKPLPAPGVNTMHDRFISGYEGSGIALNALGIEELSSAKNIPSAGWIVVGVLPSSQAFSSIAHIRNNSIWAAIVISALVLPLLWLFLRHELSPLQRSVTRISKLVGNQTYSDLPLEGSPEIQQLQTSFNLLQAQLKLDEKLLLENEALYRAMFEKNTAIKLLVDPENGAIVDANPAAESFYGWSIKQLRTMNIVEINSLAPELLKEKMALAGHNGNNFFLFKHRQASGALRNVEVHSARVSFRGKDLIYSIVTDVTARELALSREKLRSEVLESLAHGNTTTAILNTIINLVEKEQPGTYCAIMQVDAAQNRLLLSAAPNLPAAYKATIADLEIGSEICSCGIAAAAKERVILRDLQAHPFLPEFKSVAFRSNITACWSEPIISSSKKLLGTFSIYLPSIGEPNNEQIKLIEEMSKLASITIERKLDEESLRLSDMVFQSTPNAIFITNEKNQIVTINPAFTEITQYVAEDVIGRDPKILGSGKQKNEFYRAMWESINETGKWAGEIDNQRKNREPYVQWTNINTLYDENHQVKHRVAIFSDITEMKHTEAMILEQANFDSLTGLPNRRLFYDRLGHELKKTERDKVPLALMFIDLDHFKEVNDSLGHETGDFLLQDAAKRISHCIRESDTLARLGGDEFTVILPGLTETERLESIAESIIKTLAEPFHIGQSIAYVSASIGITIYPTDANDISSLLKNADQAMYVAKNRGRNQFSYFTASMQVAAQLRLQLSNDLRGALAAEQLEVYYQPIVDLSTGDVTKAEALLRWHHPTLGMISPSTFIPLAEDIGLINTIGDWVFRQSALQALSWHLNKPSHLKSIQISVNKSPRQFVAGNVNLDIVEWLKKLSLPPACIVMEITEGLLMDDRSEVQDTLLAYRDAGIQVSLDDFGTGYSAMSYLQRFDIDYIKVDQSFVRNMVNSHGDQVIVEAIIAMAQKLGMKVIAEGVETEQQREFLIAAGCDFAQGYLFARPMPAAEFDLFLTRTIG
ncbi:MAG: EAL domain-containing protein [Gallionellaceae bacterium]